jgi:hypothetical protein
MKEYFDFVCGTDDCLAKIFRDCEVTFYGSVVAGRDSKIRTLVRKTLIVCSMYPALPSYRSSANPTRGDSLSKSNTV